MGHADSHLSNQPVLREKSRDGIVTLTLARPKQRNSLSEDLLDALQSAIDAHGGNSATRVIIIAADGPTYCAGHDIKQLAAARTGPDGGKEYFTRIFTKSSRFMVSLTQCPKPVIAQVQGICSAAGCQLVASADLAVAAENAEFVTPGVDIGLFCATPMVAASRNVSRKQMMEMLLLGEKVDAARARDLGLINFVVAAEDLEAKTMEVAARIASKSSKVVSFGKTAFYRQLEMPLKQAYAFTQQVMVENMLAHDAEEGMAAFIEKRAPEWKDE